MAGREGGVRIKGLEEVDQYGTGDAARTPPEGGRLVAFQLTDWACDVKPCTTKWPALELRVRVGADSRRLPDDQGTYVVAVPAGTTTVDLTMKTDDTPQSLSLLTGEPGDDNLAVLARPDRSVDINEEFSLTETNSDGADYCRNGERIFSVVRDVEIGRATLHFFVGDLEPSSADTAFLVIDAGFTIDCRPGERFQMFAEEMRFRGETGKPFAATPFEGVVDGVEVRGIFEVPADTAGGTLVLGGRIVFPEYTTTLEPHEVPFRF